MALHYYVRDATGTMVELTNVRSLTVDGSLNAEEASVGMFRVEIDDPDGTLSVGGHRRFYVMEDEVVGDDTRIVDGYTQERVISRGDLYEGTGTGGRVISVDVADLNTILSRRVMTGADCNRPAETDVQRMQWAVLTNEGEFVGDSRYVSEANPVNMDACDYRGQMLSNVLEDCAEASGKNYFITYFGNPATLSWGYFAPGEEIWSSTARLTNVGAEVDDVTTFVVSSAELTQSPMRVYSGIYGTGDGIVNYTQRAATATAFARRDTIMSFPNVKSAAKLQSRVTRMLGDLATEEYRVAITFYMRPADVNRVRPGMRVQAKFSHLPELGDGYVWLRMLSRQITQGEDETGFAFYKISGVFSVEVEVVAPGMFQHTEHSSANTETENGISVSRTTFDTAPGVGSILVAAFIQRDVSTDTSTWPDGWIEIGDMVSLLGGTPALVGDGYATLRYKVSAGAADQALVIQKNGTNYSYTAMAELVGVDSLIDWHLSDNVGPVALPPAPAVGPVTGTANGQIAIGFASIAGINNTITATAPPWTELENGDAGASPSTTFCMQTIDAGEDLTLNATSNTTGADQGYYMGVLAVFG